MGRPPKFSIDVLLDAAGTVLVDGGPTALTAAAVARAAGAPSGSVYHRFATRDQLAASLWLRTVERFDAEVVSMLLRPGDPVELAVAAALGTIDWSAANPVDAFVLTMFRRADLVGGDLPDELAELAQRLGERQRKAVAALAARLGHPAELVSFAVAGVPLAAIRRYVEDRTPIPAWVRDAVQRSVRAALAIDRTRGRSR